MRFWRFWLSEFSVQHLIATSGWLIGTAVAISTATEFNYPVMLVIGVLIQIFLFGSAWFLFRREEKRMRS